MTIRANFTLTLFKEGAYKLFPTSTRNSYAAGRMFNVWADQDLDPSMMDAVRQREASFVQQDGPQLYPYDGVFLARVAHVDFPRSKATGLPMARVVFAALEDDAFGLTVQRYFPLEGRGKNGALCVRTLLDFMFAAKAKASVGVDLMTASHLREALLGANVYVNVRAELYSGPSVQSWSSSVSGWYREDEARVCRADERRRSLPLAAAARYLELYQREDRRSDQAKSIASIEAQLADCIEALTKSGVTVDPYYRHRLKLQIMGVDVDSKIRQPRLSETRTIYGAIEYPLAEDQL